MHIIMQADQLLSLKLHLQQSVHDLQSHVEAVIHSQKFQEFLEMALQQWVAAASCVACLALLLATIAAGKLLNPHACVQPGAAHATCTTKLTAQLLSCRLGGLVAHHHEGRWFLQGDHGAEQVRMVALCPAAANSTLHTAATHAVRHQHRQSWYGQSNHCVWQGFQQ